MPEKWIEMLFQGWSDLGRIVVVGSLTYVGLIAMIRVSGKRTLAKMNAFDLVVTVSLGSILASTLLLKDISLAEGMTAFYVLIALQYLISWSASRFEGFRRLIKAQPQLVMYEGQMLTSALRKERLTKGEIMAKIRENGQKDLTAVKAVVLETDGTLSVLSYPEHSVAKENQSWKNVAGR